MSKIELDRVQMIRIYKLVTSRSDTDIEYIYSCTLDLQN